MVGSAAYDDSYLQYAANVAANFIDPDHDGTANTDGINGRGATIETNAKTATSKAFLGGAFKLTDVTANCAKFTTATDLKTCVGLEQSEFQGRGTTLIKQSITEQVFNFIALYGMSGTTVGTTNRVDFKTWNDGAGNIAGFCTNQETFYNC